MRKDKLSPRGLEIGFESGLVEEVAYGGVGPLVETGSCSGVMERADRVMPAKGNPKGLGPGQTVESFVLLSALAGRIVTRSPEPSRLAPCGRG